ncbi:hypothetical protein SAMN06265795_103222 [Noviherbaspirillum humi]|uniref:ABC-type transport auxiliary lipoprotein component domain-containing protein n=1 Tax=Noviherbaspirillum humi TaxID=1688639 RepID=A0A239F7D1_9BURK|nr:PqiC family protein [Noviherbaspirillum humi]SNS52839.1 hypothetical protein SAMN06265795_103222 [Noviherbaspirillum humi]
MGPTMKPVFIAGIAAMLTACSSTPKETLYTLNPVPAAGAPLAAGAEVGEGVAIGPVRIPQMVDRPQLVVRQGDNQVDLLEQHRWAEPLRDQIARALAADVGARVADARVTFYQDAAGQQARYRVTVDVERFDAFPGQGVATQLIWTVRDAKSEAVRSGRSSAQEAVAGAGYDAMPGAFSRALDKAAADIAAGIQALRQSR